MKANTIKSILLALTITTSVSSLTAYAANNDGGYTLPESILGSEDLVDPNRDYHYRNHGDKKDVLEVKNIDGIFDYVKMESLDVHNYPDTSHLKYIVIHETGTPGVGARATNVFSYFTKVEDSTMFIVDDRTVLQAMPITGKGNSVGPSDSSKSDVFNSNSLSIEICDNVDGDFLRATAHAVYLVRGLLEQFPHLELKQHADAWSEWEKDQYGNKTGVSFQKDCPRIIRSESTWWTWERFVYYSTHPEEGIPFIDFIPEDSTEVEASTNNDATNVESESNDTSVIELDENSPTIVETTVSDTVIVEEETNTHSFFKDNTVLKDNVLNFSEYIDMNVEEAVKDIKSTSQKLQLTDDELTTLVNNLDVACKIEKVNPHIVLQLMNSYTGFFSFGGNVQKEDNNYGGLKNKKGEYMQYDSIQEGVFAYVQYIKSLTTKDKLILKINDDALKTIKKKGSVKNAEDLANALNVDIKFIENTLKRVEKQLNL